MHSKKKNYSEPSSKIYYFKLLRICLQMINKLLNLRLCVQDNLVLIDRKREKVKLTDFEDK